MITHLLILVFVGTTLAQGSTSVNPTTETPSTTISTTSVTTTMLSSSSPTAIIKSNPTTSTIMDPMGNCSACMNRFLRMYEPSLANTTYPEEHWNDSMQCPPNVPLNNSCVSTFNIDNCSDVINVLYNANANLSLGLACDGTKLQYLRWTNCSDDSETVRKIRDSNKVFCGVLFNQSAILNCFLDNNGVQHIGKYSLLEPIRRNRGCLAPTTSKPTIPLLRNPVGPSAITAIVVLICLFITSVLAGFFFWPKCHMSKPPPPTPKKKQPTAEVFNVAYASAAQSPTGAAKASISLGPNQIGPAA